MLIDIQDDEVKKGTSSNIPKDNRLIVATRDEHIRVRAEVYAEDDIGVPS